MAHTMKELMVAAVAREIRDGEIVFVGMRLPLIAFALAKRTHAPRAVGFFENGVIRETPSPELLFTMGDAPNLYRATSCGDMLSVMGPLQQGRVAVGIIGGAEVDRYGNVNTTEVMDEGGRRKIRLPGSGGACDIASLAGRLIIMMTHERRRFPARVSYLTSPGYGEGGSWRRAVGLPGGGPAAVITDRGILRFDSVTGEAYLASVHPGSTVEQVQDQTGWPLRVAEDLQITPPPTPEEMRILREIDPTGFWLR